MTNSKLSAPCRSVTEFVEWCMRPDGGTHWLRAKISASLQAWGERCEALALTEARDMREALSEALAEADRCDPLRLHKLDGATVGGVVPRPRFAWREKARAALASNASVPKAPPSSPPDPSTEIR